MSKFTTELRYICEVQAGKTESEGYDSVDDIIDETANDIVGDYPIFDENYRKTLNCKIIKHYYTREIGFETVGLFRLKLNTMMNEIMPYYNQLYSSALLQFNPFYDVDYQEESDKNADTSSNRQYENKFDKTSVMNEGESSKEKATSNSQKDADTIQKSTEKSDWNVDNENTSDKKSTTNSNRNSESVENNKRESSSTNNDSSKSYDMDSDTPQGGLEGIENNKYLTNVNKKIDDKRGITTGDETINNNNSEIANENTNLKDETSSNANEQGNRNNTQSSTNTEQSNIKNDEDRTRTSERMTEFNYDELGKTKENQNINNIENYIRRVQGKMGLKSYSSMLKEFRDTFLNIDVMIIDALAPLFFNLW